MPETRGERAYRESRVALIRQGLIDNYGLLIRAGIIEDDPNQDFGALAEEIATRGTLGGRDIRTIPAMAGEIDRVDRIAGHIRASVEENTGSMGATWGQIGRAFMNNPMGMLGALFQGIMGLFSGRGMAGFAEAFGPLVAPITAQDVGNDLRRRLLNDPNGLTPAQIEQIVAQTTNNVRVAGHAPALPVDPANQPSSTPSRDLTPGQIDTLRQTIRAQVTASLGIRETPNSNPPVFTRVAPTPPATQTQMDRLALLTGQALTNAQQNNLVTTLSVGVEQAATTTPPMAPMEIRDMIRDRLSQAQLADPDSMGLRNMSEADRGRLFTLMADQATASYLESRGVDTRQVFVSPGININQEIENLKMELTQSRIRPEILRSLGLVENGTSLTRVPDGPRDGTPPGIPAGQAPIDRLRLVVGPSLNERVVVDTLSTAVQSASNLPLNNPNGIRDAIRRQLDINRAAIGFPATMTPAEQDQLLELMANQATTAYLRGRSGNQTEPDRYAADNAVLEAAVANLAARRQLEARLDPNTEAGRGNLNMLTLAIGGGQLTEANRTALITTLAPILGRVAAGSVSQADAIRDIEAVLHANPAFGTTSNFHEIATALYTQATNPSAAAQTQSQTLRAAAERIWTQMLPTTPSNPPSETDIAIQALRDAGVPLEGVRDNVVTALEQVLRTHPEFHTLPAGERRTLINTAVRDALTNGAIHNGADLVLPVGGGVNMNVSRDRARQIFADLVSDQLTGIQNPIGQYMPIPGLTPGVTLGGLAGAPLQTAGNLVGPQHLQNFDFKAAKSIITAVGEGNIGSGLSQSWNAAISIGKYWTGR